MTDAVASTEEPTVSLAEAAILLGVSKQTIQNLVTGEFLTRVGFGKYSAYAVFRAYIAYLKDEARRSTKTASSSRVSDRRADEIEMRIEERSRALVNEAVGEAVGIMDEVAGPLKADMLGIPSRVTPDLALRRRLETEINDAFGAAAKRASDSAARARAIGGSVDPGAGTAARRVGTAKSRVSAKRGRARAA